MKTLKETKKERTRHTCVLCERPSETGAGVRNSKTKNFLCINCISVAISTLILQTHNHDGEDNG